MEQYQTEQGRRQDLELAMLEVNPYLGAIAPAILPNNDVGEKGGTYYYQTLEDDSAAVQNRTITAAPSRVNITETSSTWSVTETIKGYTIPRSTVKTQFGNIDRADVKGAKASLRSVMRQFETDVAAVTLVNASSSLVDIGSSFISAAQTGLKSVKRYMGKKALVMSQTIFNRVMDYTEITNRFGLASAQVGGMQATDIIARQPGALKMLLQAIIGVDTVLVGDDDIWYDGSATYQDRCSITVLPDPEALSELDGAVFGKSMRFAPNGQEYPFYIESFYDPDTKLNNYDATEWYSLEVMNAGANYILSGIDVGNAVTTTTTTGA